MKRIQEKVKDIVEVRTYDSLQDFIANPAQTVAIYHFTDTTSDLMAKWLDAIAGVEVLSGAAFALAGYRGVGKSHFLAALGSIAAHPELRARIGDAHVSAGAQRLKRRRHPVAFVRRGIHPTLLDEVRYAVAAAFDILPAELPAMLPEILEFAARKAGDVPFLMMIDTAFERTSRVLRDDGVLLGEISEIAKNLNIFVGVALDDDIAGADGVNAAIARSYRIDYLDQEHLYRIVDANIFPKYRQMAPVLHDIYAYFRHVLPSFRWSEQRFSSLYPLHPIILEIAPFVRLYVPEFALLGFTSEAGRKILGRPANSLIGLDEVFEIVETHLRKVEDLREAIAAYDRLNAEVISQIPIMQRLQAKLILKALLILSLDGEGTTASEICAAMLIFDENDPPKGVRTVGEMLETFAARLPQDMTRVAEQEREVRYGFNIGGKESLNNALSEAAQKTAPELAAKMLCRAAREKFADWTISTEPDAHHADWMECQAAWRGGLRRGRVIWNVEHQNNPTEHAANAEFTDWEVVIGQPGAAGAPPAPHNEIPQGFWQPAPLKREEIETLLRYHVLLTREDLYEQYGEQIRAAGHAHALAVEKIWNRVFLYDAKFQIDGFDYNFSEEARGAQTLSEMLSAMLEPLFEIRYPAHPFFAQTLGMTEVSALVNDLFSGTRQNLEQVQNLAEIFALPLGLVARQGNYYALETESHLLDLPLAKEVLALIEQSGEKTVSLRDVYRRLKKSPHGLVREAQHLLLTALVAQRRIEFVTSKGDRINRRSLDLKIIWDDIEGIARPIGVVYSSERLTNWAKILTGDESFRSIEISQDRENIAAAMRDWLLDWETARVLERFAQLPDEILNTKIWRCAVHAEKTFGSVARTVKSMIEDQLSLDEGLHRIADAFTDSEDEFFAATANLVVMDDFIVGAAKRREILSYVSVCEPTNDHAVEDLREKLLLIIEESYKKPSDELNRELDNLWNRFHETFVEFYAAKHDALMKSHHLHEKIDEIKHTAEWWEFEHLSGIAVFQQNYRQEAKNISRRLADFDCRFAVREMLKVQPFCACSFNLSQTETSENLPQKFWETINRGRFGYRRTLMMLRETIVPLIERFAAQTPEGDFAEASLRLAETLKSNREIPVLTNEEMIILRQILEIIPTTPQLHLQMPSGKEFLLREDLREKMNLWLDELPNEPVRIKL